MKNVRFGVIGLGAMGSVHARDLVAGKVPRGQLASVCDNTPVSFADFPGTKQFTDSDQLIHSGTVDAVVIATPHYSHTAIGIAALEAGLHVLVEKPISVHKADCERLIAAHKNPRQVFGAMFQQRTEPAYLKLRELLASGELGTVRRIQWTITNWFRTQTYYDSGGWRASWAGEGGGVLLNQCPHQLDLWQWLFGLPARVRAYCSIGRYHDIEVEDDVTAYFEYENGSTGTFITSTGEAPGTNRLEIVGDLGRLTLEDGVLRFVRNEISMEEFCKTSPTRFDRPATTTIEIPLPKQEGSPHVRVFQNFVEAILDGNELIAPAGEGIRSVELANAMLLSTFEDRTIHLPLDAAGYEARLRQKIASSRYVKPLVSATDSKENLSASFGR